MKYILILFANKIYLILKSYSDPQDKQSKGASTSMRDG
jgi:hypothetical protein